MYRVSAKHAQAETRLTLACLAGIYRNEAESGPPEERAGLLKAAGIIDKLISEESTDPGTVE